MYKDRSDVLNELSVVRERLKLAKSLVALGKGAANDFEIWGLTKPEIDYRDALQAIISHNALHERMLRAELYEMTADIEELKTLPVGAAVNLKSDN